MKRILAITLTLIMALAALTGCMASQNPSGSEGEQNPSGKRLPITLTIAETLPSCVAFEYKDEKPYCFYAYDTEGNLYRVLWNDFTGLNEKDVVIVDHNDDIRKLDQVNPPGGWTPQYEMTAISVKKENSADENLVSHIQIQSGTNTIRPFGCVTWSKTDNGDGTFSESTVDKYDVVDLVSGKTNIPVTDIPTLSLDESVSYLVQVNGRVEKVYLLTPTGNIYTKSETTFNELSNLADGTYYVVLEVLLSGNCDPDAPQNSYRYEDVFCLVVGAEIGEIGTSDEEYGKIQLFPQPIPEFSEEDTYDTTKFLWARLTNDDMDLLRRVYNDGKGWTDDSVVDRAPFFFDGRIRFATTDSVGWMYFGFDQNVLYYNGMFTEINAKVMDILERVQQNEELTHSGYEVEIKLFQYTWDGWGISTKTVGACDVAYNIIDALKAMKETGETVPKISDDVLEIGGGQYPVERGTMWIDSGNKIYRLTPDLSQICLVETHFGEGKVLEITEELKTDVNNAWYYAPYDYYKGTYNKGDYTVDLESVFQSGSTVQLSIKKIQIESDYDPNNTITVELLSTVDQEVNLNLHCQQSDDNLAAGDYRTVQLKKGEPTTVDLTFGGWPNFTYWVYIEADFTKAEITINP